MRSYTNRKGETVNVDEKHLKIAVSIKLELQKSSPSRKCNWSLHKKLMEKEGFSDSDTNESYRCLIKDYQKTLGKLPSAQKYADMVTDGKLESIKELVGELAYEKRDAQNTYRQLNKVKRDVIDKTLFVEAISNAFESHDFSHLHYRYKPIKSKGKKMIVCLSDLHIGALVDTDCNKYNFEIAKKRMYNYLNKVVYEAKKDDITDIYLVNLGDTIEHPYMHNLAYSCEFNLSEQIAMASDIIISFMMGLINAELNVTIAGIAGNHDRFNEDKKKNLHGDHAVKGINKAIESFIRNAKIERVTYEQAKDYEHSIEVNGINIKFVHGDLDNPNDKNILAKHSSIDEVNYSLIVMGHYHKHMIVELGIDKYCVVFGSLKGADNYGESNRMVSSVSQGVIKIDEDGEIEIKRIRINEE